MKITFLLPGRGFSGGVRVSIRMAAEMSNMGYDVKVLYRVRPLTLRSFVRNVYHKFVLNAPSDWVAQFSGECASFRNLSAELVGNRDVVMAIGPDCVEETMKLPDECGCKVFNVHGLTLRNPSLRKTAWNTKIPKIVVSNYVRQEMLKSGVNDIVAVVPNGIDTTEYFPDEGKSSRTSVGTVYAKSFAKDPQTILSVFASLHRMRPEISLICFGSSARPKELIQAVQYHRMPTLPEARRLYSRCLVWFCASRSEGFGVPPLEAMACSCVVVCTDCGGPNDYLKSGVNGIIVGKEAPDKMVDEILKIIDDKSKRTQIANNALETAKTLSWPSAACKMEAALKSIISGQQR